jgi:galactokinase
VLGARMTGGGFGGCAIVLVRTAAATSVMQQLCAGYAQHFGMSPALFVSRAAAGAGVLQEHQ